MDEPFPINRIAHLFPARALDPATQELLSEFTDTAVEFLEDPLDWSPSTKATPLTKIIDSFLQLMVREAVDEGATQISIKLRSDEVAVSYLFADGQVQERDSWRRHLFRPLIRRIKLRCNDRHEFVVDDRIYVGVRFDDNEPCDGLTLTIRREECRPSEA